MGIGALGVTGIAAMALGVSFVEAIRRIVFVIIRGASARPLKLSGA